MLQAGTSIATSNLPPTHQVRLGLALNFSVFYYDILGSNLSVYLMHKVLPLLRLLSGVASSYTWHICRACLMSREAFDEAILELDSLNEESYKDSTHVLQLIRDNLTIWAPKEGGNCYDYPLSLSLSLVEQTLPLLTKSASHPMCENTR